MFVHVQPEGTVSSVDFHFPLPSASQKDARASNMGKRAKVRDARPAHAEPAHRLTPPMSCCPQNQKEGLRKPKSGNSKPPDGLQGVAMAKGKSMPHSHESRTHWPVSSTHAPARGRGEGKTTCDPGCGAG